MAALARGRGGDEEAAYLAGLMREIGMVVIDQVLAAEKSPARWDCYGPVREWELAVAGRAHPEIGAALLARWTFAPEVCAAVRHQWEMGAAGGELARALHLTNLVLERCGCDFSLPLGPFEPYAALATELGFEYGRLGSRACRRPRPFRPTPPRAGCSVNPARQTEPRRNESI